jgi:hypothetical protein
MKKIHGFPLEQVIREAYLAQLGASFAEFRKDPQGTLEKYGQHDAITIMRLGYRPLLPVQARLRRTLEAQWRTEGTWDDSMATHATSPTTTRRFFQRIRKVLRSILDAVMLGMPEHAEPTWNNHAPGQVAMSPPKRHHMSHGMP